MSEVRQVSIAEGLGTLGPRQLSGGSHTSKRSARKLTTSLLKCTAVQQTRDRKRPPRKMQRIWEGTRRSAGRQKGLKEVTEQLGRRRDDQQASQKKRRGIAQVGALKKACEIIPSVHAKPPPQRNLSLSVGKSWFMHSNHLCARSLCAITRCPFLLTAFRTSLWVRGNLRASFLGPHIHMSCIWKPSCLQEHGLVRS